MDLSPQAVRTTAFKIVKKGYDPDEVDVFKDHAASAIEAAQNQATAMEARARAAVAKLQEVSQQATEAREAPPEPSNRVVASADDVEIISRTLLLAQRTADTAVAEARAESDALISDARTEATALLDSARAMSARLLDEARSEARRSGEDERMRADGEVQALLARRDFLLSDVDHLEQFLEAQRERLSDAAVALRELVERVPGGLGDIRRPLLSASGDHASAAADPSPIDPSPARHATPSLPEFAAGEAPSGHTDADTSGQRHRDAPSPAEPPPSSPAARIDDLWATTSDAPSPSVASDYAPMHVDEPIDMHYKPAAESQLDLGVTTEVPVIAPSVQRETLRIIGDESDESR